jgi:hypothetical protein
MSLPDVLLSVRTRILSVGSCVSLHCCFRTESKRSLSVDACVSLPFVDIYLDTTQWGFIQQQSWRYCHTTCTA